MDLRDSIDRALAQLLDAGQVKVQESGSWLAALEGFQYEIQEKSESLVLHLWSQNGTLVRRVRAIDANETGRLALRVSRFGRTRPDLLEFVSRGWRVEHGRLAREQFRAQIGRILARRFPDEPVSSLTTAADLEHSLSGNYVRGTMGIAAARTALMAAAPGESSATYDALLTFGLIWLDHLRHRQTRPVHGLRLFFPMGCGSVAAHRLRAIVPSANVQLFEYDQADERLRRIDPQDSGNIRSWLVPRRDVEGLLAEAEKAIAPLCRMHSAIKAQPIPGTFEIALRFRGLSFARWTRTAIYFGIDSEQPLTGASRSELAHLVHELDIYRSPVASSRKHMFYRVQPERWLESMVAEDLLRIDPHIDPNIVYSQVPANSAGDRGIVDLLGITRNGRLVILELKATEDVQLVLQAADYWLRVRRHQEQQDFTRYGYFPAMEISTQAPLLLLVAPAIRFHPTTEVLAGFLSPEIEICRVGLNENWRRGLRVMLRQNLHA